MNRRLRNCGARIVDHRLAMPLLACTLVACTGDERPFEEALEAADSNIARLEVLPLAGVVTPVTVGVGERIRLTASAFNGAGVPTGFDSEDRSWQVSDSSVASIDRDGLLLGRADGSVDVGLSFGGLQATPLNVTVSSAELVSIASIEGDAVVEPCLASEYLAIGNFSDGSERTLSSVTWSGNPATVADLISEAGDSLGRIRLIGTEPGVVELTATAGGNLLSRDITISDNLTGLTFPQGLRVVDEGGSVQLMANGTYTRDGVSEVAEVTNFVSWSVSADTGSATITNAAFERGLLTGTDEGIVTVTARCGDFQATQTVQILSDDDADDGDDDGLSLSVDGPLSLPITGGAFQLQASTGSSFDADNEVTDSVDWSSNNPNVVDVSPTGVLQPINLGNALVTAQLGGDVVTLSVTVVANL